MTFYAVGFGLSQDYAFALIRWSDNDLQFAVFQLTRRKVASAFLHFFVSNYFKFNCFTIQFITVANGGDLILRLNITPPWAVPIW
jgi:hypothetical protein